MTDHNTTKQMYDAQLIPSRCANTRLNIERLQDLFAAKQCSLCYRKGNAVCSMFQIKKKMFIGKRLFREDETLLVFHL